MPFAPKVHGAEQRARARVEYDRARGTPRQRGYCSAEWMAQRKRVWLRDGGMCRTCGRLVGHFKGDWHCDHIIPKRDGGTDDESNLQTLCVSCHSRKTLGGA